MDELLKTTALRPRPPSLPTNSAEWEKARRIKHERTLNDHVEDIHLVLIDHPTLGVHYKTLLDAVYDEDATEGSLSYDNFRAAGQIRAWAKGRENGDDSELEDGETPLNNYVANKKLSVLVKALNVVLNRYGWSRKERARTVGGEVVANVPNNGSGE